MQDSDKNKAKVKAMNAIRAQVKAIAEEFQVTESTAFRIIEDALAAASCDWGLSGEGDWGLFSEGDWCLYSEAQGTGHKCQDRDESMVEVKANVKAMNAIAAQVKAIAEEFQVTESTAFRIIEDALGAASCDWGLSASEAQGTGHKRQDSGECGHKCGEGACKAKEKAQAPVPVRKPAATEAAAKTADEICVGSVYRSTNGSIESVWSASNDEVFVGPIWVSSQNRVTIPSPIIELAVDINGVLNSKRHNFGALTVIKGDGKVTVLFGDKSAEHEGASVVHLNCKGQAQFCASPAFTRGDAVKCFLFKDGTITLTLIGEDD